MSCPSCRYAPNDVENKGKFIKCARCSRQYCSVCNSLFFHQGISCEQIIHERLNVFLIPDLFKLITSFLQLKDTMAFTNSGKLLRTQYFDYIGSLVKISLSSYGMQVWNETKMFHSFSHSFLQNMNLDFSTGLSISEVDMFSLPLKMNCLRLDIIGDSGPASDYFQRLIKKVKSLQRLQIGRNYRGELTSWLNENPSELSELFFEQNSCYNSKLSCLPDSLRVLSFASGSKFTEDLPERPPVNLRLARLPLVFSGKQIETQWKTFNPKMEIVFN